MWGTVLLCVAQLAAGYFESQNGGAGFALGRLLEIQRGIAQLIHDIQNVIAEIEKAVEAINRETDRVAIENHLSKMESVSRDMLDAMQHLAAVEQYDPSHNNLQNPNVTTYRSNLLTLSNSLHDAVTGFVNLDRPKTGGPPTLQSFVCCASSVAMWARAYQLIESYLPVEQRIPVYRTTDSAYFKSVYKEVLDVVADVVASDQAELDGNLLAPDNDRPVYELVRFQDRRFVKTNIIDQGSGEFPADPIYAHLFNWHRFGSSQAPRGLWGTVLLNNKHVMRPTASTDDAYHICTQLHEKRRWYQDRLKIYGPIHSQRAQALSVFDNPNRPLPTFTISVINEGPEGTVIVTEHINQNESIEVLRQLMAQGERIDSVECVGTGYKRFHWINVGSGDEGDADKADGLTLHVDPQGKRLA